MEKTEPQILFTYTSKGVILEGHMILFDKVTQIQSVTAINKHTQKPFVLKSLNKVSLCDGSEHYVSSYDLAQYVRKAMGTYATNLERHPDIEEID